MKKLITCLCMGTAVLGMAAQEETLFDLSKLEVFNSCEATTAKDGDDYWAWSSYYSYAQLYSYSYSYYEDYLTTPEFELKEGTLYKIQIAATKYYSYDQNIPLKVLLGTGEAPTEELRDLTGWTPVVEIAALDYFDYYNASDNIQEYTFNVAADGQYRLSIYGTRPMKVCTFRLISMGESDIPQAVNDLMVLPAADGSASAEVSFTLPPVSISNKALSGRISYTISCGDEAVKGGSDSPGAYVSWTHNPAPLGEVTYTVVVKQGENVSEPASVSTFIGPETPTAVTNVSVTSKGSTHTVKWDAPTEGVHGASLDPAALSYTITRIVDGTSTVVTETPVVGVTEYVDTYEPVGLQSLSYEVAVSLGDESADAVASNTVLIGSLDLPFIDSFVGAADSKMWTVEVVNGLATEKWEFGTVSPKQPVTLSYDGDDALAYYNSYNINSGKSSRLYTAPISRASSTNPLLQFYMYHHTGGNDVLKVQVSADGGEWVDVPDASWTVKGDPTGWTKHTALLSSVIPADCESYRVSLTALSAYGFCMVIDAVSIVNLLDKDIAVTGFTTPETHIVGNTLSLAFNVANNSGNDVEAGEYTLQLTTDFPEDITLPETVAIPAVGSVPYVIEVPIHSLHAIEAGYYTFKVTVALEGDEDAGNNSSPEASVNLGYSDGTPATELVYSRTEDGLNVLSWTPADDPDYVPVDIHESFEDLENGTTDDLNGWTVLDLDERSGGTYYTTSGSKLHVSTPTSVPTDRDGSKVIGCTFASYAQQNDWLISPELSVKEGVTLDLSFMVALRSKSSLSSSNKYAFEVLYATEDYDPEAPATAFSHSLLKKELTSTYYGDVLPNEKFYSMAVSNIPSDAKYVAIHLNSKLISDGAMWLDKIELTENDPMQLQGYHVYQLEAGRLNEEILPTSQTEYVLTAPEAQTFANLSKRYFVSAVYPDGEAVPSNIAEDVDTGIESVAAGSVVITAVEGGVSVSSEAPVAVVVSDLTGRTVAAFTAEGTAHIALSQGIYIVKAATASAKVVVR